MAEVTPYSIEDTWAHLRANPVFQRTLMPRSVRLLVKSPVVRGIVLTVMALALFEFLQRTLLSWVWAIGITIAFWFLIEAIQRYFCWMEMTLLARTGTLGDYLNSGLTPADVALGVIYPARIAEQLSILLILTWWLVGADDNSMRIVFAILIFMSARRLFSAPMVLLADAESYMRKRHALSLYFISFAVVVPLVIFFSIYFALTAVFLLVVAGLRINTPLLNSPFVFLVLILLSSQIARFPQGWFEGWRLRRFYTRYRSFDELIESFLNPGADAGG